MSDINLNSPVLRLKDFPPDTDKIMILYDERGWAIRCYGDKEKYGDNNKLTTMIPDGRLGDSDSDITLVPREQV